MANVGRVARRSSGPRTLDKKHKHAWKVVLIGTEPVGVSCSCGESRGISSGEVPESRELLLDVGENVVIRWSDGVMARTVVDSVQVETSIHGQRRIHATFVATLT